MADPASFAAPVQRAFGFMDDAGDAVRAARLAGNADAEGAIIRQLLQSQGQGETARFLSQLEAPPAVPVGMPEAGSEGAQMLGRAIDNDKAIRSGRMANLRNANPLTRVTQQAMENARLRSAERAAGGRQSDNLAKAGLAGAGVLGAGLAIDSIAPPGEPPASAGLTSTGGTEDLADESRPAPVVEATDEDEFTDRFKRQYLAREEGRAEDAREQYVAENPPDYSFQARGLIEKLNAMRRAAGGEVPEAPAMMAEINRLLALSNQQRNAPGYQPAMPPDHHGQAQLLIQQLNEMRRKAGGEVPQAAAMMAEIRRHQALGDQQRWSRR